MLNETYTVLSTIDTATLLAELAYRTESPRKYDILEGKFSSFEDYNGDKWAVKLENRSLREV